MSYESFNEPCLLDLFYASGRTRLFPGLVLHGDELILDSEKNIRCCGGRGLRFDPKQGCARRCEIQVRVRRMCEITRLYHALVGTPLSEAQWDAINLSGTNAMIQSFDRAITDGRDIIQFNPSDMLVGGIWSYAFMSVWKFAERVSVFSLAKMHRESWRLLENAERLSVKKRIFVTRLDELRDPDRARDFETIVSYAYHAKIPLVLENPNFATKKNEVPAAESEVAGFSTRGILKRKVIALNRKLVQDPLVFLEHECRSRLKEMGWREVRQNS